MGKIYFASDIHLGKDTSKTSLEREELIVQWLLEVSQDADAIYLVGDIFDYWYEYRHVVPKGFDLLKATLLQLRRSGVRIELFTGNHDLWMKDYFEVNLDIPIHRDPITIAVGSKSLYIGHGDGLGPGDLGYKFIKAIFRNRLCQVLFSLIHPNLALSIMKYFSQLSNKKNAGKHPFTTFDKEWLVQFVEEHNQESPHDYYIFGHRHLAIDYMLRSGSARYINLGDWMEQYTYAVLADGNLELKQYLKNKVDILSNIKR